MPFSYSSQLSAIVGFAERLQPQAVLDVGVGMGQYGFLLRMNLEHLNLFRIEGATASQRPRSEWQKRIDGIEGYPGYFTPVHHYVYDRLLVGDALEQLAILPAASYDLVLAIDILEHFKKPAGRDFLRACERVSRGVVLVSTPKDFLEQHVDANPLEDHRSHWTQAELRECGFANFLTDPYSWIGISWQGHGVLPAHLLDRAVP